MRVDLIIPDNPEDRRNSVKNIFNHLYLQYFISGNIIPRTIVAEDELTAEQMELIRSLMKIKGDDLIDHVLDSFAQTIFASTIIDSKSFSRDFVNKLYYDLLKEITRKYIQLGILDNLRPYLIHALQGELIFTEGEDISGKLNKLFNYNIERLMKFLKHNDES